MRAGHVLSLREHDAAALPREARGCRAALAIRPAQQGSPSLFDLGAGRSRLERVELVELDRETVPPGERQTSDWRCKGLYLFPTLEHRQAVDRLRNKPQPVITLGS